MGQLSERCDEAVRTIAARDNRFARGNFLAIVLGSGLGAVADCFEDRVDIPYEELPSFAQPGVQGHLGRLSIGTVEGTTVVAQVGRLHLYEGHSVNAVVHPVRTLVRGGAKATILTNAAGGIDPSFAVGDLMVITDHINLSGHNPLSGSNDPELGPRFPDLTRAWNEELTATLLATGEGQGQVLRSGTYAGVLGPSYETPAEIRMLDSMGAHAVGMSTVLEAIAVRHMGGRLCGMSVISNVAAGMGGASQTLDHNHVADAADKATSRVQSLLAGILRSRENWWETA